MSCQACVPCHLVDLLLSLFLFLFLFSSFNIYCVLGGGWVDSYTMWMLRIKLIRLVAVTSPLSRLFLQHVISALVDS